MIEIILIVVLEILLIAIAMLCRSLVHNLLHHYSETKAKLEKLFKKKINDQWWSPAISWINKKTKKVLVQFSDAFHTFNTIELGAFDLAITIPLTVALGLAWWWGIIIFLTIGILLMPLFFNLGYDKFWR